ncbi:MAG: radical SAM protein, partial [Bdellovibrionota bacterium]
MRILLLTPPLTQLNTPYPATSYLSGFLRSKGIDAVQSDLGIGLALQLFSKKSLERIEKILDKLLQSREPKSKKYPPILNFFLENAKSYQNTVECVVKFLQGKDPTLSLRILSRDFLPEGPRFNVIEQQNATFEGGALYWAFGSLGIQDQAKYLASLFIDDLADLFKEVDSGFGLSRYQEKLAASAPSFDPILAKLEGPTGLLDSLLDELSAQVFDAYQPDCVGISVPFPGNVYGAFRIANQIKKISKIY